MEASQVSFSDIAFRAFASAKGVKTSPATLRGAPVEFLLSHEEFFHARLEPVRICSPMQHA